MSAYIYYPDGTIVGSDYDDYLYGSSNGEWLLGFKGNDTIRGNGGNDYLEGDDGDDTLEGGSGNDALQGGNGNDTVSFFNTNHGVNANIAFGTSHTLGAGPTDDDTFAGIENISGSFYDDYLQGDEGNNRLDGNAGADVLQGWGGNDVLNGGFGTDTIIGGEGNDRIGGGFDHDYLQGGNGFDTVDYTYSYQGVFVSLTTEESHTLDPAYYVDSDSVYSFEGIAGSYFDDILEGNQVNNVLAGGDGNDRLSGLAGNDMLDGGNGNDILDGGAGGDVFIGGAGIDWVDYSQSANSVGVNLAGGYGNLGDALGDTYTGMENIIGSEYGGGDVLLGDEQSNNIDGRAGNDVIYGHGGDDFINGGDGVDYIDGGTGYDTASFVPPYGGIGPEGPGVSVDLQTGVVSGLGNDGEQIFNVEAVIGTDFDDIISGNAAANDLWGGVNQDRLSGRTGNDRLYGESGNDVLNGGDGDDLLLGGSGRDVMSGNLGHDVFVFGAVSETGTTATTRDIIRDFSKGNDLIDLSAIDANLSTAGDQAFTFIDDDPFFARGSAGQLRSFFSGSNTIIEGDVNGDGVADFQIQLTGNIHLSALDFIA